MKKREGVEESISHDVDDNKFGEASTLNAAQLMRVSVPLSSAGDWAILLL